MTKMAPDRSDRSVRYDADRDNGAGIMIQVLPRETLDQRVVINGTWEQFKLIKKAAEDSPGIKLSFFADAIEILMPGFQHENFSEIIGYLVTTFLLMQGIRFYPSGSMTQEKTGEASTQADKSFCLGEVKSIPDLFAFTAILRDHQSVNDGQVIPFFFNY
jgi:hypothetical protein